MQYLKINDPILVIIGPSGAGKSEVIHKLIKDKIIDLTATHTTRPRRPIEEGAKDHVFCSDTEFNKKTKEGLFIEVVQLFNQEYLYGLPKIAVPLKGRISTIMLRAMVMPSLKNHYSNAIVYQIESDKNLIENRIASRQDASNAERLKIYEKELILGRNFADRIFVNNDTLDSLYHSVAKAIREDFSKLL